MILLLTQREKIFRLIRVIDFFWQKSGLHFEPARKYPTACSTAVT